MTVAGLERQAAGLAGSAFVRDTHAAVEGAVRDDGSIMFEIKEFPVRDFDDTLADNIIIGPNNRAKVSGTGLAKMQESKKEGITVHNTKLELLDNLRHPVNDLGLTQVHLRTFRGLHGRCQE